MNEKCCEMIRTALSCCDSKDQASVVLLSSNLIEALNGEMYEEIREYREFLRQDLAEITHRAVVLMDKLDTILGGVA